MSTVNIDFVAESHAAGLVCRIVGVVCARAVVLWGWARQGEKISQVKPVMNNQRCAAVVFTHFLSSDLSTEISVPVQEGTFSCKCEHSGSE
jgi:hypothetical protein